MSLLDSIQRALGLRPRFPNAYAPPQPIPVAPPTAGLVPINQPQASLTSSRDHARGRAETDGSLVSGR
jgi:hypothetical protein